MARIIGKAAVLCTVASIFVLAATATSSAQRYGYRNYWWIPQYDTSGARINRGDLGWHGGWRSGAPANPCTIGKAMQNRC